MSIRASRVANKVSILELNLRNPISNEFSLDDCMFYSEEGATNGKWCDKDGCAIVWRLIGRTSAPGPHSTYNREVETHLKACFSCKA